MERVLICRNIALETGHEIKLRIEDARLRKWYGNAGREELQGAGSVNRDASIWETRCKEQRIDYRTISPTAKPAKMKATPFSRLTRMARDRIRARQGCRKAENKTEGVRLTLQPITTNPAPDYGIKGDAKITKNLKYGDHLRKRAIPTNTGKRTNPGRFIRQVGRTPHFG